MGISSGIAVFFKQYFAQRSVLSIMADDLKVKTYFTIDRLKLPLHCGIQTVLSKKEKELVLLSSGGRFLYFFEGSKILNIVLFPGCVRFFVTDGKYVLVVTEDGKVWRMPYSRHGAKPSSKPDNPMSNLPTNQAIFSDLLSNNPQQQPNTNTTLSVPVFEVCPNHAILCEPGICCILPYKGLLVTAAVTENDIMVSFYEKCEDLSYDKPPFNRVSIRKVVGTISPPLCLLLCNHECSGQQVLQRSLFDFINPNGEAEDSVVLLGTPDGRLLSINISPTKINLNKPELVWDLKEPVCYLFFVTLSYEGSMDKSKENNSGIIIVGKRGKCVILYDHQEQCSYSKHNLTGPIISCSISNNLLFYSNGKEVCVAKLSVVKGDASISIVLQESNFLIGNVAAMCTLKLSNSPDSTRLVILTLNGKVMEATLPCDGNVSCLQPTTGNQLKDLLSSIEQIALQTKSVQKDLDTVEVVLQQLNKDLTLIFKMKSSAKPTELIKWTVCPGYSESTDSYYLTLKLYNISRTKLLNGWSLLVQIGGLPSNTHFSPIGTISHSWNLGNLDHGMSKEFSVTLPAGYNVAYCLSVEAHVCYNLNSLIDKIPIKSLLITDTVLLSIGRTNVDILHFMASQGRADNSGFYMPIQPSQLDSLESFCQAGNNDLPVDENDGTKSTSQTIRLPITKNIFTSIPKPSKPIPIPLTQELQLLYNMMCCTDEIVEIKRTASQDTLTESQSEERILKIWLESTAKAEAVILHGTSTLEFYALLEAFASRLRTIVLHFGTIDKLDERKLKETLQHIEVTLAKYSQFAGTVF